MHGAKVGDIVGFSGYNLASAGINLATYGIPFWSLSHVGIMGEFKDELLLFESTTLSDIPCRIQGKPFAGSQAVRLSDRLESYRGAAWLYPLYRLDGPTQARLNKFLISYVGMPYDHLGAARSGLFAWSWLQSQLHDEDLTSLFCSEWCAAALQHVGFSLCSGCHSGRWNPNLLVRTARRKYILGSPRRLK